MIRMVLDTDTYNEVDDQFALVYALLSKEVKVEAIYAAPFFNERSDNPKDGMLKSYNEIIRLLNILGYNSQGFVFKGSDRYIEREDTPCVNEAVNDLINKSFSYTKENPLYVISIGAPTNVSSAILLKPEIKDRIRVVWLGGNGLCWPKQNEFNQKQDLVASRILFDSGVDLVQIPCWPVASHLKVSVPELKVCMGESEIARDLTNIVEEALEGNPGYTRVIWDISAVAYAVNPDFLRTQRISSPVFISPDSEYLVDNSRHLIESAYYVNRDKIFEDFYKKIREL